MNTLLRKYKKVVLLFLVLLLGFVIRIFFVEKVVAGDLLAYVEWGQKLLQLGFSEHYIRGGWYITAPNYGPFSQIIFAGLYWLFDNKHIFAQLHNVIKIPPAAFIVYFYKYGDLLVMKLPGILCDLGISIVVYKIIFELTRDINKAFLGLILFLFNPVTVFMSGGWGQTDSVVAILGLASFMALNSGKAMVSLPLLFLSLYFKPSWGVFIPFYLYLFYLRKPKLHSIIKGVVISIALFLITTIPFANGDLVGFSNYLFKERLPLPSGAKASISAFNFQTIFFKIDLDFGTAKLLGITANTLGTVFYVLINLFTFYVVGKEKNKTLGLVIGLFMIGIGGFLFMSTMLERYFFPAFAPLVILMVVRPKLLIGLIIMNIILFANLIWAFYRRRSDEIDHPFTNNNFFVIRVLSVVQTSIYLFTVSMLKSKRE